MAGTIDGVESRKSIDSLVALAITLTLASQSNRLTKSTIQSQSLDQIQTPLSILDPRQRKQIKYNMPRRISAFRLCHWPAVLFVIAAVASSSVIAQHTTLPSAAVESLVVHPATVPSDSAQVLTALSVGVANDVPLLVPEPSNAATKPTIDVAAAAASSAKECLCPTDDVEAELASSTYRIEEMTTQLEALKAEVENDDSIVAECQTDLANAIADRNELTTQLETLKAEVENDDSIVAECQTDLADAIAGRNDSIQSATLLDEKIERLEKKYQRLVNETNTELDTREDEIERQKHQLKQREDRYQDTRRQLLEVDKELREMHKLAGASYVNFTLMQEDAWNSVADSFSSATRRVERKWGRHHRNLRPRYYNTKRRLTRVYKEHSSHLDRKMTMYKRNVNRQWAQSKLIRPLVERARQSILGPLEPIVNEVEVATRLSLVSAIEESSKSALYHLEWRERNQDKIRERELKKLDDPVARRNRKREEAIGRRNRERAAARGRGGDKKDTPQEKKEYEPSKLNLRARVFFKYTLANSKRLYKQGVALLPLAIALSVNRCGIVGSFFLFCGIPTPFIWAFVVVKYIVARWKKKGSLEKE